MEIRTSDLHFIRRGPNIELPFEDECEHFEHLSLYVEDNIYGWLN
jgi:hypothetical protein